MQNSLEKACQKRQKFKKDPAIDISSRRYNRARRIVDTILKAFQELKAGFSVERGNKDDITIRILSTEYPLNGRKCSFQ